MAQINSKSENGTLVICIEGRIDSTNSTAAENDINKILDESTYTSLVLDLEKLEYISSAGLRVILRLRKSNASLEIVNVSSDVYEIFDMTGFTEMMTIKKAYRKISVDGCEIIGQGANGRVYRIDDETIVKYYLYPDALPDIQRERELAKKAFVLGIPTAIPYDIVKVGDGYGSVFELLNADSFAKLIVKNPDKIDEYAELATDVMLKMHSTDVQPDDMPDQRQVALGWIKDLEKHLPADIYKKLYDMYEAIPESTKMMHGDYHIKNIMMQNNEVILIDMDTLCRGNAIYELGSVFNAYQGFADMDHNVIKQFLGIEYEQAEHFYNKTLELYFNTTDKEFLNNINNRIKVVGYTRLMRRSINRNLDKELIEHYKNKLIECANCVDSLAL